MYGLCVRERDSQYGGGGRERGKRDYARIRGIRVDWKLKENRWYRRRKTERINLWIWFGRFRGRFLKNELIIIIERTWNSIPFGMESIIFPVVREICSCNKTEIIYEHRRPKERIINRSFMLILYRRISGLVCSIGFSIQGQIQQVVEFYQPDDFIRESYFYCCSMKKRRRRKKTKYKKSLYKKLFKFRSIYIFFNIWQMSIWFF